MSTEHKDGPFAGSRTDKTSHPMDLCDIAERIREERMRADRSGRGFSVLVFELSDDDSTRASDSLLAAIATRTRMCDEVGWLGSRRLGVLLPATGRQGAALLATDVKGALANLNGSLSCTVNEYPTESLPTEADQAQRENYSLLEQSLRPVCSVPIPIWKRIMDVIGSVVGLVIFAPALLLIALCIKIVSPGPVLFKQRRIGYQGKAFVFLKFRTMKPDNDASHHERYLAELIHGEASMTKMDPDRDPRIIPGGRIIRKLALDELPQFFNVLKGEMSLVGPRPCIPYEAVEYSGWHAQRFDVLPGLTGLWQVSGKNKLSFKEMIRLDNAYSKRISFWLDVRILLMTFPALFGIAMEWVLNRLGVGEKRSYNE